MSPDIEVVVRQTSLIKTVFKDTEGHWRTLEDTDKDDRPGEAVNLTLPADRSSLDRRHWEGELGRTGGTGRTGVVKLAWQLHQPGQIKPV